MKEKDYQILKKELLKIALANYVMYAIILCMIPIFTLEKPIWFIASPIMMLIITLITYYRVKILDIEIKQLLEETKNA